MAKDTTKQPVTPQDDSMTNEDTQTEAFLTPSSRLGRSM